MLKNFVARPSSRLSDVQKRIAVMFAKEMLDGVGCVPSIVEQNELAFHYRRSFTDFEVALLPATWCAIAPVDDGGGGLVLERDT